MGRPDDFSHLVRQQREKARVVIETALRNDIIERNDEK